MFSYQLNIFGITRCRFIAVFVFFYRIEPLLVKGYARVAPLIVQPYNASFRTPYAEMPTELIPPEQGSHDGNSGQGGNNKEEFSPGGTPKGSQIYFYGHHWYPIFLY